jgi:hypothetical protein
MPASTTSVFSTPADFQAALRKEGAGSLLITGHGRFLARLTKVELHRLRLAAAEEHLPRIGFLAVPADMVVVSFPLGERPAPIYGGVIPIGWTVDSYVNRRDAAGCDSSSPSSKGDGDDGSDHTAGALGVGPARGGGRDAGREGGATDVGSCPGAGGLVA